MQSMDEMFKNFLNNADMNIGRGTTVQASKMSPDIENFFKLLSQNKNAFEDFLQNCERFNKFSVDSGKILIGQLIQLAKKYDLDTKSLELAQRAIEQKTTENQKNQLAYQLRQKSLDLSIKTNSYEKSMYEAQFQMRRNAIDDLQKNFYGPLTGMFKGNLAKTFIKETVQGFSTVSKSFVSTIGGITRSAYTTMLAQVGNTTGSVITSMGLNILSDLGKSAKEFGSKLKEGYKQGKEQYFQNKQEQITKLQEKTIGHLDKSIRDMSLIQQKEYSSWQEMISQGKTLFSEMSNFFKKEDNRQGELFEKEETENKNVNKKFGNVTTGGEPNTGDEIKASRVGAIASGIMGAAVKAVPYIGEAITTMIGRITEIWTLLSTKLAEVMREKNEFMTSLNLQVGNVTEKTKQWLFALYETGHSLGKYGIDSKYILDQYVSMAKVMGSIGEESNDLLYTQIKFNKLYSISGEEAGKFYEMLNVLGENSVKGIQEFSKNTEKFARIYGTNAKLVMQDIARNTDYIARVGSPLMVLQFEKASAQLHSMNVSVDGMMHSMEGFEDFGSSVEKVFQLNAALGTSFNPISLHLKSMTGDFAGFQQEIKNGLKDINTLNYMQMKVVSDATGLSSVDVRNLQMAAKAEKELLLHKTSENILENQILDTKTKTHLINDLGLNSDAERTEYTERMLKTAYEANAQYKKQYQSLGDFVEQVSKNPTLKNKVVLDIQNSMISDNGAKTIEEKLEQTVTNQARFDENQLTLMEQLKTPIQSLNFVLEKLNDVMLMVVSAVGDKLMQALGAIVGWFAPNTGKAIAGMGDKVSQMLDKYRAIIGEQNLMSGVTSKKGDSVVTDALKADKKEMGSGDYWENVGKRFLTTFKGLFDEVITWPVWSEIGQKIGQGILDAFNPFSDAKQNWSPLKGLTNAWNLSGGWNIDTPSPSSKSTSQFGNHPGIPPMGGGFWNSGGYISGPGGPKDDKILSALSNGEYVIPANIVSKVGKNWFDNLVGQNKFKDGKFVSNKNNNKSDSTISNVSTDTSPSGTLSPWLLDTIHSKSSLNLKNAPIAESTAHHHHNLNNAPIAESTAPDSTISTAPDSRKNWFDNLWSAKESDTSPIGKLSTILNHNSYVRNSIEGFKNLNDMASSIIGGAKNIPLSIMRMLGSDWAEKKLNINKDRIQLLDKPGGFQMNQAFSYLPTVAGMVSGSALEEVGEAEASNNINNAKKMFEHLHYGAETSDVMQKSKGFKNGMATSGSLIPGFVNTSDIPVNVHSNERMSVQTSEQAIKRDMALQNQTDSINKLISILTNTNNGNNKNIEVNLNIDGQKFQTVLVNLLRQVQES